MPIRYTIQSRSKPHFLDTSLLICYYIQPQKTWRTEKFGGTSYLCNLNIHTTIFGIGSLDVENKWPKFSVSHIKTSKIISGRWWMHIGVNFILRTKIVFYVCNSFHWLQKKISLYLLGVRFGKLNINLNFKCRFSLVFSVGQCKVDKDIGVPIFYVE